jgi:hypothetical protein
MDQRNRKSNDQQVRYDVQARMASTGAGKAHDTSVDRVAWSSNQHREDDGVNDDGGSENPSANLAPLGIIDLVYEYQNREFGEGRHPEVGS